MLVLTVPLLLAVISSCIGSPQETVKESIVGEEDTLMRRTGLGHHGYGGGTSCLVKGSYCRLISLPWDKSNVIIALPSCHYCKCEHGSIHCHAGTAGQFGEGNISKISGEINILIQTLSLYLERKCCKENLAGKGFKGVGKHYCYGRGAKFLINCFLFPLTNYLTQGILRNFNLFQGMTKNKRCDLCAVYIFGQIQMVQSCLRVIDIYATFFCTKTWLVCLNDWFINWLLQHGGGALSLWLLQVQTWIWDSRPPCPLWRRYHITIISTNYLNPTQWKYKFTRKACKPMQKIFTWLLLWMNINFGFLTMSFHESSWHII